MRTTTTVFRRAAGAAAGVLALVAALVVPAAGTAGASPLNGNDRNGTYLALGDSVAFGYVPPEAVPAPDYNRPRSFVGYPELVAQQLGERVSNAACPGETTASMLSVLAQSNGCENAVGSSVGYRTEYPLHVRYKGSQVAYAVKYLTAHKHVRLVTIDIGANDAFICEATTGDHCTSPDEVMALIGHIEANLAAIYTQIRDVAGYRGPLVALTYYSTDYADTAATAATYALDQAIAGVTAAFGGVVADGFGAFAVASAAYGDDPCAAGLLIPYPTGGCNIHPSLLGHEVLAQAVEAAVGA